MLSCLLSLGVLTRVRFRISILLCLSSFSLFLPLDFLAVVAFAFRLLLFALGLGFLTPSTLLGDQGVVDDILLVVTRTTGGEFSSPLLTWLWTLEAAKKMGADFVRARPKRMADVISSLPSLTVRSLRSVAPVFEQVICRFLFLRHDLRGRRAENKR